MWRNATTRPQMKQGPRSHQGQPWGQNQSFIENGSVEKCGATFQVIILQGQIIPRQLETDTFEVE